MLVHSAGGNNGIIEINGQGEKVLALSISRSQEYVLLEDEVTLQENGIIDVIVIVGEDFT